jgi:Uma2 family endonuclease
VARGARVHARIWLRSHTRGHSGDRLPPAASGRHGGAQLRLGQTLAPYDRRSGGWWFASETEIQLDAHQVFRPDVAGWRRERLPELPSEVPILVRPDWVCEILSKNLEVLVADRSERVRAEPFEAIDLAVGVLFGEDDVEA